jgi:hypothetical protein
MIYLMQILNQVPFDQLNAFYVLFSDISEHEELGYTPEEYVNQLLETHFGMSLEDEEQLKRMTATLQKPHILKSAVNSVKMLRESRGA